MSEYYMPVSRAYPWHCLVNIVYTFFHRKRHTINHQTGDNHYLLLALIGGKSIVTIHDLVCLKNTRNRLKWIYKYIFYLYLPVKIADRVVCISNKTRNDVLQYISTDKIAVIYNPINPIYRYTPKVFHKDYPIILHIGAGWNKNLKRVVMALQGIPCLLRIIGVISDDIVELLNKYKIDYSIDVGLSDEQIKEEYKKCDIVSFPSIYEGFGMPIIEGQKTGRIVVTSYIEPLVEVSAGAAILVNPEDIDSIREGFILAIENDPLRERLIKEGVVNAARFDSKKIAAQYMDLYRNV